MDTSVTVLVLWALRSTCCLLSLGDTHPLVKGKLSQMLSQEPILEQQLSLKSKLIFLTRFQDSAEKLAFHTAIRVHRTV